jgi:hypothetical protein
LRIGLVLTLLLFLFTRQALQAQLWTPGRHRCRLLGAPPLAALEQLRHICAASQRRIRLAM